MARSDHARLDDMRERCASAIEVVRRGRAAFDSDELLRLALERSLEIIGEAANHVSEETRRRFPTVAWDEITRLRVLMAHHYHRVNPDRLWVIATDHVPPLAEALGPLVDDESG